MFDITTKDGEEEEEIILQLSQKDDGATFMDRLDFLKYWKWVQIIDKDRLRIRRHFSS